MKFTDGPLESFGTVMLDKAIASDLSLKTGLMFRIMGKLVSSGCLPPRSLSEYQPSEVVSPCQNTTCGFGPERWLIAVSMVSSRPYDFVGRNTPTGS